MSQPAIIPTAPNVAVRQGTAVIKSDFAVPDSIECDVQAVYDRQKAFFATGKTLGVDVRIAALRRLRQAIIDRERQIEDAMKADLGKSAYESYFSEIGLVLSEIDYQVRHVRRWAKPRRVPADFANFPSRYFTVCEPYGCVLVMARGTTPFCWPSSLWWVPSLPETPACSRPATTRLTRPGSWRSFWPRRLSRDTSTLFRVVICRTRPCSLGTSITSSTQARWAWARL